MADEIREHGSFDVEGTVSEMSSLAAEIGADIPMNDQALTKIRSKDSDPRFIVVEIEETERSGSGRIWPGEIVRSIAEQVNKKLPVGHLGHIDEKEVGTAFPDIQAMWLGAVVQHKAGKLVARVKGYLLPESKARGYAEIGVLNEVSVYGDSTMVREKGGLRVKDFILESIDFARKGRGGMPTRVVAVTSEMSEGGKSVESKDIAALSVAELREHAPLVVQEIERTVKEPLETTIGEQTAAVAAAEPKVSAFDEICKALGIKEGENPVEAIVALMDRVEGAAKERIKSVVDKALEKVAGKDARTQSLVRRLVGEQITDEFKDADAEDDDLEEKVEKRIGEMVEADEDVKAIVGEMSSNGDEGKNDGPNFGKRSRTDGENEKGRSGGIKRTKRTVA